MRHPRWPRAMRAAQAHAASVRSSPHSSTKAENWFQLRFVARSSATLAGSMSSKLSAGTSRIVRLGRVILSRPPTLVTRKPARSSAILAGNTRSNLTGDTQSIPQSLSGDLLLRPREAHDRLLSGHWPSVSLGECADVQLGASVALSILIQGGRHCRGGSRDEEPSVKTKLRGRVALQV